MAVKELKFKSIDLVAETCTFKEGTNEYILSINSKSDDIDQEILALGNALGKELAISDFELKRKLKFKTIKTVFKNGDLIFSWDPLSEL